MPRRYIFPKLASHHAPYANGVIFQSPVSRSARWVLSWHSIDPQRGSTNRCVTPLGYGLWETTKPSVRFATLGFGVKPLWGNDLGVVSSFGIRLGIHPFGYRRWVFLGMPFGRSLDKSMPNYYAANIRPAQVAIRSAT